MVFLRYVLIVFWFAGATIVLLVTDHLLNTTHWLLERLVGVSLYVTLTLIVAVLSNEWNLSQLRE